MMTSKKQNRSQTTSVTHQPPGTSRRRQHLRSLKRLKPSRRHVRTALMAGAPTAALIGFGATPPPRAQAVSISAPAPDAVPFASRQAAPTAPVEASYYGDEFAGRPTANGEIFDPGQMTAAHRTLPFGSLVRVSDADTGRSVVVRINDRGPFHGDRAIDLSEAAAREIGMLGSGTAKVSLAPIRNA